MGVRRSLVDRTACDRTAWSPQTQVLERTLAHLLRRWLADPDALLPQQRRLVEAGVPRSSLDWTRCGGRWPAASCKRRWPQPGRNDLGQLLDDWLQV